MFLKKFRIMAGAVLLLAALTQMASAESLWRNEGVLFTDAPPKSFRAGDIIQIQINERTSALTDWKSERQKDWDISGEVNPSTDVKIINDFTKILPFLDYKYKHDWSTDNNAERKTTITASVAVNVVGVLPNGNLELSGDKIIKVNNEEQTIRITGTARPDDVNTENTIDSNKIANANIRVVGSLSFSDQENPGLLPRILTFFGNLFF